MKKTLTTLALASLLGVYLAGPGMAQAPAAKKAATPTYKAPRGPGGKPDLSGVWQVLNTANWDIEPHAAKSALARELDPPADIYNSPATKRHLAGVLLERAWTRLTTSH